MIIYLFLKVLVKVSLGVFYRKITVHGRENLPDEGPLIMAVNHPNTLLDPLLAGSLAKQRVGFLANASIFINGWVSRIFTFFHVIPVYRKKDVKPGQSGNNVSSFRKCFEYLDRKGTILIFPEGTSISEWKLRKIKTGTARIALGAEARNDFTGGLKIVTVALNYSDPVRFRTDITVNISPPIEVDEYAEAYRTNSRGAVEALTDHIRQNLESSLVITDDKSQESLLLKVKTIYADHLKNDFDQAEDAESSFAILQGLADAMRHFSKQDPDMYEVIQTKTNRYFRLLDRLKLTDAVFEFGWGKWNRPMLIGMHMLYITSLLPVYLFGLITNYIPYIIPAKVADKADLDIEYRATILIGTGLVAFPIFYALEIWLFNRFLATSWWHTVIFGIMLPLAGALVLPYWNQLKKVRKLFRLNAIYNRKASLVNQLADMKSEIILLLDAARIAFEDQ